ncbi:band 4.1-like protein 4A [Arctopsyche grandis]|uniref:band 4.1-like protein 4A n=1 Tax=Arctopsyche grandis TaxID=121162 RepID=UPI00406DA2E0
MIDFPNKEPAVKRRLHLRKKRMKGKIQRCNHPLLPLHFSAFDLHDLNFILTSELGDYDPRRHPPGYVSEFRLQPGQTPALEARAAELHRTLAGQTPATAEMGYLDRAKWLELYGADLHPVLGEDSVEYFLGLAPSGVLVLRNKRAVASYYWPRITKLYSKGKYFMLRVCDKNNEVSTYGFETPNRGACRHLWRCCSEQHAFFRLQPTPSHVTSRNGRQAGRSPPTFTRIPSRRLQRRPLESSLQVSTIEVRDTPEAKPISIPQPALSLESPYRSTCSIPAALGSMKRSDSPRSTRSAPFPRQGMYSGPPSPRATNSSRIRSSSLDSHSSNDSRSCRRHRHRSRRTSDAESEASRGSGRSRRRRRHRSRHKSKDSADETDSKHRSSTKRKEYELVESGGQWREIQRKQATGGLGTVQQASVRRAVPIEPNDPSQNHHRSSHRHRRHRKHRSRSRSPSESKSWLPSELKQHLEWDLVDTDGMSVAQLKEIPYTVVQTSRARQLRLKQSNKHRSGDLNENDNSNSSYLNKTNNQDFINSNGGSIRSISSTISSGRNNGNSKISDRRVKDPNSKESSQSGPAMGDPRSNRITDIDGTGGNSARQPIASASNSSSGELISSSRVSHEHTDSGLGADQDYAYSSER